MTTSIFTRQLRKLGLYRKSIGPEAIKELASLVQSPAPVIAKESYKDRSNTPTTLKHLGKLVSDGLAQLNREKSRYEATNEGRKWLGKIIDSGILNA